MRIALILTLLVSAGAAAQDASFLAEQEAEHAQEHAVERVNREAQRAGEQAKRATARTDREDGLYRAGTRAIDQRQYEQAVSTFDRVIEAKSSRADGALYWRAYAQNRLGQREQALATLAQLQKEYPQSRWSGDAKALDVEVRQASGRPVSPDNENDEDLKLLAINGLMASDPSRALPPLQKVIADPKASPRVKERALFVVAQSGDPKARDLLLQIAKGGGNPDMQLKAVEYLGVFGRGNTQPLADIYASTTDLAVKRAILHGFMIASDADRLLSIAKTEKSPDLRMEAIRMLGVMKRDRTGDVLLSLYASETDRSVKQAIIDGLFIQQNAKALIDLARKETDMAVKKELVQRLSVMKTKEASDYMMELINK